MATNYTCKIAENDDYTFIEYARDIATGFAALSHSHVMTIDTRNPLPLKEPSSYYIGEREKVKKELETLQNRTLDEWCKEYETEMQSRKDEWLNRKAKNISNKKKYTDMLKQAYSFSVPSPDFIDFKKFMIQQIESSIQWENNMDWSNYFEPTFDDWKNECIESCKSSIQYYTQRDREYREELKIHNKWILDLEDALKPFNK
jgi:hypothetical protein